MKILVVEDQPIERKLVVLVLCAAGHEVDAAVAAEPAFASIEQDPPSVLLLDLSLPGIDGLALVRKLKANTATRDIPIIAMTSYPEKFSKAAALEAGCDAYLYKPLSPRTLPATITEEMAKLTKRQPE